MFRAEPREDGEQRLAWRWRDPAPHGQDADTALARPRA